MIQVNWHTFNTAFKSKWNTSLKRRDLVRLSLFFSIGISEVKLR